MAHDPFAPPVRVGGPSFRAWGYLIAGCSLIVMGVACCRDRDSGAVQYTVRAFLFGGGLLSLAAAIARRLQNAPQDIEARIVTASLMVTAGFAVLLAYLGDC